MLLFIMLQMVVRQDLPLNRAVNATEQVSTIRHGSAPLAMLWY